MFLSEWRKTAPNRECMSNSVLDVLKPVLADLGADGDPSCWVIWGEDPEYRYSIMAPTPTGLATIAVRLNGGGEDPRVTGKLVRWAKLQVSELSVEASGGIRIVAVQVEGQVLKGMDEEAGKICEFVRGLLAGIDGRAWQAAGPIVLSAMQQVAARPKAAHAARAGAPRAARESAPAAPGKAVARKSGAKGPGAKPEAARVAPHPIALPARLALPAPSATPAAHTPQERLPAEPGLVWDVPSRTESIEGEKKAPRTWTP